jgi:hypothetical protein
VLDSPVLHGQKRYYQILLDPARAALLDRVAENSGVRTTALIRDWLYARLQQSYSKVAYQRAYDADMRLRADSISRQVEGRRKPKAPHP